MRRYGLTGYPLTHSWSQSFFNEKFKDEGYTDCRYELFPKCDLSGFREWISAQPDLLGLNVTIPHKISIINFLDETDKVALEIGAVNTIKIKWISDKPILKGFNTDAYGFRNSLPQPSGHHHALILGTGGASKAVAKVFDDIGIDFKFVSRKPQSVRCISYKELDSKEMNWATMVINTTPLGMYPQVNTFPSIPYEKITPAHLMFDLVYNPEETFFLKKGKERGAKTLNGLSMLKLQAEEAFRIFFSDQDF